jgi:hypothetical protein
VVELLKPGDVLAHPCTRHPGGAAQQLPCWQWFVRTVVSYRPGLAYLRAVVPADQILLCHAGKSCPLPAQHDCMGHRRDKAAQK